MPDVLAPERPRLIVVTAPQRRPAADALAEAVRRDAPLPVEVTVRQGAAACARIIAEVAAIPAAGTVIVTVGDPGEAIDGAALRAARRAGAIVVLTAGAPARLASNADVVAEDDPAPIVTRIFTGDDPADADGDVLHELLGDVRTSMGIDFREYKSATILRRLGRLMAASGYSAVDDFMRHLRRNPEGYSRLVSSLLINVTQFFRDPAVFAYLRDEVLPELIAHANANGNVLRIWSAGCATGEESYSLAILVCEALGNRIGDFNVRIFATDVDEEAIAFARRGLYPQSAFTDVPPELVEKYFTRVDDRYEVKKAVRNITVFGQHDLAQRAPFPRIDLCLCRNVLIYFSKELQQRTLHLFAFSLRDGGYLVLGKAETTSPLSDFFSPLHRLFKVYRRQGPRVLIPPSRMPDPRWSREIAAQAAVARPEAIPAASTVNDIIASLSTGRNSRPPGNALVTQSLQDAPVGYVIVDRRYDILALNAQARAFLNIHGVGVGEDLIHAAAGIATDELRAVIDAAFAGDNVPDRTFELGDPFGDDAHHVALSARLVRASGAGADGVLITLAEISAEVRRREEAERQLEEARSMLVELEVKNERLVASQRSLVAANEELTHANVELRSSNEHLLIAAEEAASAAEEIETLNEEMQATNEELETLNEELQATVEELNTTNDELQARSLEFQDLAAAREAQRLEASATLERLGAALDHLETPVAIVQNGGSVEYGNRAYRKLIDGGRPAFVPLDGEALDAGRDPFLRAARGERFSERFRVGLPEGGTQDMVLRASPLGTDGQPGAVLSFEDDGAAR